MRHTRPILAVVAVLTAAPATGVAADAPGSAAPAAEAPSSEEAEAPAEPTPPKAPAYTFEAAPGHHGPVRRGSTWDLNIDLAYGLTYMPDERRQSALARIRAGWLLIHEPWFPSLGLFADVSNTQPASFGVQAEAIHLWTGLWGQLGLFADVKPRLGVSVAAGYSFFGVEANGRFREDKTILWTVFGKLRIPVGLIHLALSRD